MQAFIESGGTVRRWIAAPAAPAPFPEERPAQVAAYFEQLRQSAAAADELPPKSAQDAEKTGNKPEEAGNVEKTGEKPEAAADPEKAGDKPEAAGNPKKTGGKPEAESKNDEAPKSGDTDAPLDLADILESDSSSEDEAAVRPLDGRMLPVPGRDEYYSTEEDCETASKWVIGGVCPPPYQPHF